MSVRPSPATGFMPFARALSGEPRTEVELTWIEKRHEQWLRFGRAAGERIVSRRTRIVSFRPGAVFAFVRWSGNDYGTVYSRIDIVQAVGKDLPYTTVPFVQPGGEVLLSIRGWPKVEQVLAAIDPVEVGGVDPCDVSPDHWRHVAGRIAAGAHPRPYGRERHDAWLRCKALGL
ncbi:hypothetical protein GCM10011349_45610 [Novosphingobium indicum]|uniref:Glycosidase n=2 Tax=Novosphingobium indicum TaxID=462949 RepID=A0ABQ2K3U0_9SPHN|nr:hypothetical protein GCM10011349_45610 [Novosphingobium indicum]